MLDQHINKLIEKHTEKFSNEIQQLISSFKKEAFTDIKKIKQDIASIHKFIKFVKPAAKKEIEGE